MPAQLEERDDHIERHLRAALAATTDHDARYHLREAIQLRIAEKQGIRTGR